MPDWDTKKGVTITVATPTGAGGGYLNANFANLRNEAPYNASSNPGSGDDSVDGFFAGSRWFNTSTQTMWVCTDASAGAAVWRTVYKRQSGALILCPGDSANQRTLQVDSGGNTRGNDAVDLQANRSASTEVASGARSVIAGGQNNIASGDNSAVGGGYANCVVHRSITASTIAFVNSNPDTITDSANGFLTAGFRPGTAITVTGSTSGTNDNTFTIESVTASTITLIASDSLTAQSAGPSVTISTQARKTATTISFTASPPSISDSGNGFLRAGFRIGQMLTVSGSVSNNGTYQIQMALAGTLEFIAGTVITNESAGATITITSTISRSAIAGGGENVAVGNNAFVGAGWRNSAGVFCVVGGGSKNTASNYGAVVAGYNNRATGYMSFVGSGGFNVASGGYSVVCGGGGYPGSGPAGNVAQGDHSGIVSGLNNRSEGIFSLVGGGTYNTASAVFSFIGGGTQNTTSGIWGSAVLAGTNNTASGGYAAVVNGYGNTASGKYSIIAGGYQNTASGYYTFVGTGRHALADKWGQQTHASGSFSAAGDSQTSQFVLRVQTTNNTATEMFLDGSSARLTLPNNTTWAFWGIIAGRRAGATEQSGWWQIEGVIKKDATVGSTTLLSSSDNLKYRDNANWTTALAADTTNGALKLTVTGDTSNNVNWVAFVRVVEIMVA